MKECKHGNEIGMNCIDCILEEAEKRETQAKEPGNSNNTISLNLPDKDTEI